MNIERKNAMKTLMLIMSIVVSITVIGICIFCGSHWNCVEYSSIVGYSDKDCTWTREDMERIVYDDDDPRRDEFGEFLRHCPYEEFKTNVLSRLCRPPDNKKTIRKYGQMARELKVCFGFAGLQGKRIVAFSLKARTAEDVAEFLDTCAETAVALYPVSQNTSLEQTISRMQHEVHRQKKSLQRAIDKKENNKKDDGELESKLQADVERAQKWYDYMKLKLEEVEKLRNTVPYKIQVIKHAAEESYHVME